LTSVPRRIAILGWGSLLWEGGPEFDSCHQDWQDDGPSLDLEFSRISSSRLGALTLVIDARHGAPTTVAWCLSTRSDPADAVNDLRCRERCASRHIARLDLPLAGDESASQPAAAAVARWARPHRLDVVIWTALESNFSEKLEKPFSIGAAISYLEGLSPKAQAKAKEYLRRAPAFVRTPLRSALASERWLSRPDAG